MAENSNDEWDSSTASFPDFVFEARLRAEEDLRNHFWQLYTNGPAFVRSSIDILLDSVKFLYGEAVSGRVRVLIARELTSETMLKEFGLCLALHAENPWVPHSRINILEVLNVDLQQVLTERDYSSAILQEFWNFQGPEGDNLPLVEVHVEAVHGIFIRCDFRDLLDRVRQNHATLLEAVIAILGHRYNLYPSWRTMAREPSSTLPRCPVDWGSVNADPRPDASW
jgi:hypothetical protein